MALNPPFVVRVDKKPERSFGAIINDIRTWLDHRMIEPVSFQPVAKADTGVGFEIAFHTEVEAQLFEQEFALAPSVGLALGAQSDLAPMRNMGRSCRAWVDRNTRMRRFCAGLAIALDGTDDVSARRRR